MRRTLTLILFAVVALCGARAQSQALDNLLNLVRPNLHAPGWMDNYLGDGVLHDYGIALWEMPESYSQGGATVPVTGGGYNNLARVMSQDPSFYLSLQPSPPSPFMASPADFVTIDNVLFKQTYSKMDFADFPTIYNQGTSVCLQNMVFAPRGSGAGITYHTYPEVAAIEQQSSAQQLSLYADIGFQNNWLFVDNLYELNATKGLLRKTTDPEPLWALPLFDPALVNAAGIDPRTFLYLMILDDKVGLSTNKFLPKPMLDTADPAVISLCLDNIRQIARDYWDTIRFYVGGEFYFSWPPAQHLSTVAPVAGYSARDIASFQQYMAFFYGTFSDINTRWGITGTPFELTQIGDISEVHVDAAVSAQAVVDFHAMNYFRRDESRLLQVHAAKAERPAGVYGFFGAERGSVEVAGLTSDFPSTGEWYNTEGQYFAPYGNNLSYSCSAARLAGTPLGFGITSAPTEATATCPTDPGYNAPGAFAPRCFSKENLELTQRDALLGGSVHHGYIKAVGWGTFGSTVSRQILENHVASVKAIRDDKLRFMTPHHRINVHVDADIMRFFPGDSDTPARRLHDRFVREHRAYAPFSDLRQFRRRFGTEQMGRGIVISAFHRDLDANLMNEYVQIASQPSLPLVVVMTDFATYLTLTNQPPNYFFLGAGFLAWQPGINLVVIAFPDDQPATTEPVLDAVLPQAYPFSPDIPQPIEVTQVPNVESTMVSDGVNYFLAVSNRSTSPISTTITVSIHPDEVTRTSSFVTGYTFEGGASFTLGAKETRFLLVGADLADLGQVTNADITNKIAQMTAQLATLGSQGYDVGYGQRALQYVGAMDLNNYKGRAVVGLAQVQNMIFLKPRRTGAQVTITAQRYDGTPVAGAHVQLLHVLNGRESQDGPATNAAGQSTMTIGAVTEPRWDFTSLTFIPPTLNPTTEPVEVHVHDPSTGNHAFVLFP